MTRSFLLLLLAGAALVATAQTAPRPAHKTAAHKPAAHKAAPAAPVPAATTDAAATDGGFGNGAPSPSANDGGKGQGVYAAPGMPVDVVPGKEVEPYNSTNQKPSDKPRKGTTLSPK